MAARLLPAVAQFVGLIDSVDLLEQRYLVERFDCDYLGAAADW